MSDVDDLSGLQVGEYVLREPIGEGGYGTVYSADQPRLGRVAVVKILHRRLRRSDNAVQRFMREAQLACLLHHPYAAHIYAFGSEERDRLLWIAMERVHGVALSAWLATRGPMPLGQFVPFFERIASVVQAAHDRGIVHRDLKPSNVMVIEGHRELLPKLLDFGVAKLFDGSVLPEVTSDFNRTDPMLPACDDISGKSPIGMARAPEIATVTDAPRSELRLTQSNQTVGSPPYMSPEQWSDPVAVGPASDLYALAVVAFEALTGRRPFQAETIAGYIELHCHGNVPLLGGNFPPALDRMLQRALSKRPEDRYATALELSDALRVASGLGGGVAALPKIEEGVRDTWLADAPQPLAESVAALDGAENEHQAQDAAQDLARNLLRYLLALAIATRPASGEDDPALLESVRALNKRALLAKERLQLLRLLVRPHREHPIPELVELVTEDPDGTDALEPILELYSISENSGSVDSVRRRLQLRLPVLTQLLHKTTFLVDYVLVVPRGGTAERWTGRRQEHPEIAAVLEGEPIEGHPMLLDRGGRICADLWPLVQAAAPSDGAKPELFVFDSRASHGAEMIAASRHKVHDDSDAWAWVATHLIAKVETKARMRDQIQTAARQWHDRARSDALLWRGDVLADYVRWTRHTTAAPLEDPEASFIAASRRVARRTRWIRSVLVAVGVVAVVAGIWYRGMMQARIATQQATLAQQQAQAAQQIADASITQAEVEQGRQALLHGESSEARLQLTEAYRRGDHSRGVTFMLARALQPRLAEQARFSSTASHMRSAAFSPDGRQIVMTDDRNTQIWDAQTRRLLFMLPHGDVVYHAVYSADGTKLVTACGDGTVRIWDARSGELVHDLKQAGSTLRYYLVALSPEGDLVAAIDTMGAVTHVWDAVSGEPLAALASNGSGFPSLSFSSDGRWLATSGGNDLRLFDTRRWRAAPSIMPIRVRSLSWDPTGPRLLTGAVDGDATIWEIPSGAFVHHVRDVGEPVDSVAFSPDGQLVATATRDGAVQVWDARSGTLRSRGNYLRDKILSVEFDATSKLVLAAGANGTAVVADAALGMTVAVLEGSQGVLRAAHFDPTSRRVVGASLDGTARVWDATSPYLRWSSPPISDDCGLTTSLEPDQRFVASGCQDRSTRVWDTAQDRLLAELPPVTPVAGDFTSAFPAVSTGGDRAAIARGNTVVIYELPGGRQLRTIAHVAAVNAVAFASAGHDLVSGAIDGSLLVTRDGREPIALPASPDGIDAAGFLRDGRVVAAAGKRLRVYDPDRGAILAELAMPARVGLLRASPDGHRAVTVSLYTTSAATPPTLWDPERYRIIDQLKGHTGRVFSARFVAGGHILTAGIDGTARRWDGSTGQLRETYRGNTRFLADATLTPDGAMIVGGGDDGLLRFWDAFNARPLWNLQAHRSRLIAVHFEGNDIVTRGFAGDISRWTLPDPARVIEACDERGGCGIVAE
jgi:WD40 repeat protein/serine/threonine protein kinase